MIKKYFLKKSIKKIIKEIKEENNILKNFLLALVLAADSKELNKMHKEIKKYEGK